MRKTPRMMFIQSTSMASRQQRLSMLMRPVEYRQSVIRTRTRDTSVCSRTLDRGSLSVTFVSGDYSGQVVAERRRTNIATTLDGVSRRRVLVKAKGLNMG